MTTSPWQPLSDREAGLPVDQTVHEGVPEHLEPGLRSWIKELVVPESLVHRVVAALRLNSGAHAFGNDRLPSSARDLSRVPADLLLDVVDCLLYLDVGEVAHHEYLVKHPNTTSPLAVIFAKPAKFVNPVDTLDALLADSASAYQVREEDDVSHAGLERVVEATVADSAVTAMQQAESSGREDASVYLRSSWAKAYALRPDASGAYIDAVRAVEAVAIPLYASADPRPTLGAVIRELNDNGKAYSMVILDNKAVPAKVDTVLSLMKLLWHGHRDRHPGGQTSAPITLEAAQAAVHIAVLLVQLLSTTAVTSSPQP
ncbi:hypothetical protein AB0G74_30050 [Streptomyces sp. NPDC020875]|uniref:hypothetical protein n=1 Tax=Streptomyces sp. NPDC020875 TaxID=3154898 RepID=UPI0033EBD96A